MLGRLREQVLLGAERRIEGHHGALVDRVHRRIRDLREQLLEVVVQHARPVGEAGQRLVVAHRADRPLAFGRHRRDQELEILAGVAEDLLQREAQLRIRALLRSDLAVRQVIEDDAARLDPFAVGLLGEVARLHLLVFDDAPFLEVDEEDPAGLEPPLAQHALRSDVEDADLGGHHDETVLGDDPAGRTQSVAIEHGADLATVGEGDRRGAVPGLHQERVVLVERAPFVVHLGVVLPRLGDHHQDRFGQLAAGEAQELEHVVELRRVAGLLLHDRIELRQILAE